MMTRLKRIITTGIVVAVLAAIPAAGLAQLSFSDVPDGDTYATDIGWLAASGVTKGCNPPANTEFCPQDPVTRAQLAAFLHRLATNGAVDAGTLGGETIDDLLDSSITGRTGPIGRLLVEANLATAAFQDVAEAEAAGYASTLDSLGCFENPDAGGMGLHYLNEGLLDATVDASAPEALVYELDHEGNITGLVAHEYIVPVEAWTDTKPPSLFGRTFHQHSELPLWILHAWIWKDNPAGTFQDFNPKVRLCPDGVPVFGEDLP